MIKKILGDTNKDVQELVQLEVEFHKLKTLKHLTTITGHAITWIILALSILLATTMICFGLSLYLSNLLQSYLAGFGITGGLIFLVSFIVFKLKRYLIFNQVLQVFAGTLPHFFESSTSYLARHGTMEQFAADAPIGDRNPQDFSHDRPKEKIAQS